MSTPESPSAGRSRPWHMPLSCSIGGLVGLLLALSVGLAIRQTEQEAKRLEAELRVRRLRHELEASTGATCSRCGDSVR